MSSDVALDVSALAINVTIPKTLRWTDTRRGEEFTLTTLNIRLLPERHLAARAYGRPSGGGRGTYVSFPCPTGPNWRSSSSTPPAAPARCGAPTGVSAESSTAVTPATQRLTPVIAAARRQQTQFDRADGRRLAADADGPAVC